MKRVLQILSYPFILLIKFYQYVISPAIGPKCRFTPTCSQYFILLYIIQLQIHIEFMKKILIILLFALSTKCAVAQIYDRVFKPFKMDVSAGYAIPQASGAKGGVLFAIEPKYSFIGDQVSFG